MKKSFLVLSVLLTALAANAHGASAKLAKASKARASAPQADLVGTSEEAANVSTGTGGMIEVDPAFGIAMIGPTDVNGLIRDQNDAIQKAGEIGRAHV